MFLKFRKGFLAAQKALEANNYEEADRLFSEILSADPQTIEALLHRALVRLRLGRYNEALEDAKKVTELRPDNSLGLMIQGEILNEQKQFAEAYSALRQACAIEKDNGRAFYALGRACAGLGKKHEAGDYFELALQFERDYSLAQFMAEKLSS